MSLESENCNLQFGITLKIHISSILWHLTLTKKGYLELECYEAARKGYEGVIDSLYYDEEGRLQIGDVCTGTSIDGVCYEYYISRKKAVNVLHGSGAFILMCSEFEY